MEESKVQKANSEQTVFRIENPQLNSNEDSPLAEETIIIKNYYNY